MVKSKLDQGKLIKSIQQVLREKKLHLKIENDKQKSQLISDLSLKIHQSSELKEIIEIAVYGIQKILKSQLVTAYKITDSKQIEMIAQAKSLDLSGEYCQILEFDAITQQTVVTITNNENNSSRISVAIHLADPNTVNENRLWGILTADYPHPIDLTSEDIDLLENIVIQLGISIQQASLLQQLREDIKVRQKAQQDLAIAQHELREINKDLESRIQQRTEKLLETNQRLQINTAELQRSNQELEQYAYVASHDLRGPLRKIHSYSGLLIRRYGGQLDERADSYINSIQSNVNYMTQLISDLLEYSRIGKGQIEKEPVPLNDVLKKVLQNLDDLIRSSEACIMVNNHLPVIQGNLSQLRQLFQNLLENSLKYRSELSPEITIDFTSQDKSWQISICDNGIGIDPQFSERIFKIFQRLHLKEEYEGTGIGLAICKRVVEHHGGKIWIESQLGEGSIFYIELPK